MNQNHTTLLHVSGIDIDPRRITYVGHECGDPAYLAYTVYLDNGSDIKIYQTRWDMPIRMPRAEFILKWQAAINAGAKSEPMPEAPTLRDQFAGQAMQGIIAAQIKKDAITELGESYIADSAYSMADFMLKARQTKEGAE